MCNKESARDIQSFVFSRHMSSTRLPKMAPRNSVDKRYKPWERITPSVPYVRLSSS